jgi:hypothetical protein
LLTGLVVDSLSNGTQIGRLIYRAFEADVRMNLLVTHLRWQLAIAN